MGKKLEKIKLAGKVAGSLVPYLGEYLMFRNSDKYIKSAATLFGGTFRILGLYDLIKGTPTYYSAFYGFGAAVEGLKIRSKEIENSKKLLQKHFLDHFDY